MFKPAEFGRRVERFIAEESMRLRGEVEDDITLTVNVTFSLNHGKTFRLNISTDTAQDLMFSAGYISGGSTTAPVHNKTDLLSQHLENKG